MRVFVVTPPEPVVTIEEARAHLRVEGGDEDAVIAAMVAAATATIDGPTGWLGRALGVQTLEARFDVPTCWRSIRLPCPPAVDLVSIGFRDGDRVDHVVDPGDYELLGDIVEIIPRSVPWAGGLADREGIRVRYRAGYVVDATADPIVSALPAPIRAAILLMTGDLYANRESAVTGTIAASVPMSTTVEALLAPFRVFS